MVVSARGFDPAVRVNLEAPARVLVVPKKGYAAVVEREWRTEADCMFCQIVASEIASTRSTWTSAPARSTDG